ncbi:hypothetical protein INR49_020597 [Caranx melampygus]|nr:hypothetical protein INR49_020597 [Caranx melampygus]
MDCESQTSLDPPRPGGARAKPQTLDRPDQTRGEQSRARIHQASKRKKRKGSFLVTKPNLRSQDV